MAPRITRNHEYAKILARTVKDNRGFTSLVNKVDIIDSADVIQIASGISASSLTVYDTLDSLPTSSLTKGGQGYVKATQRLYISDSFGWYSAALVNLTPTQTLDPAGNVTLSTDGTSTIVTITATDSDQPESQLSYSVESDGNMLATGTTVTQDSSVFTITPLSEDSGGVTGNFTLTFKTTDNVNIATTTKDFSLAFTTPTVSGSASTIALMKADGFSKTNSDITYRNSFNNTTGFTETGDPTASTFSPYRSGGYSGYFDGSGDYLTVDLGANSGPDGDCTFEFWVYYTNGDTNSGFFHLSATSGGFTSDNNAYGIGKNNGKFTVYKGTSGSFQTSATQTAELADQWVHLALVRSGSTVTLYVNGVADATTGSNSADNSGKRYLAIGGYWSTSYLIPGYIRDFRYVKGTAVYTSNFTPPTEPLTAITGTQFLMGGLPYFADQSTNGHSITINGDASLKPFGPYDYLAWTADDVGGSVYFDGTGDKIYTPNSSDWDLSSGSWTIECWVYLTGSYASKYFTIYAKRVSGGAATTSIEGFIRLSTGALSWFDGTQANSTGIVQPNTWSHCAWVHNGTNLKMFLNGKNVYDAARSVTERNYPLYIGGLDGNNGEDFEGFMSDFRITKGTAKYSSDFTPPTAPLSHDGSTTKMLMNNKSDANIYDVASAGRISLMGNANTNISVRKFTTSSSVVHGDGGVRFDELTPEYLGGDFTIQFWLYPSSWNNSGHIFGHWVGGQYHQFLIYSHTGADWKFYASSNNSTWNLASAASVGIDRWTNSWKHVAMTYDQSAGTVKFWLNGTLESTHTGITGLKSNGYTSSVLSFGEDQNSGYPAYSGYIQDIKVSRSVEYTGNFTPPTTEFEL